VGLFADLLAPGRVAVSRAPDKWAALRRGLELFEGDPRVADPGALAAAVRERERILPTGLGLGLAVPHVRHASVRDPVASLVVLPAGVDYGSLDGAPVKVLLTVAMPPGCQSEWLRYLAAASTLFRGRAFREALPGAADAEALWALVRDR